MVRPIAHGGGTTAGPTVADGTDAMAQQITEDMVDSVAKAMFEVGAPLNDSGKATLEGVRLDILHRQVVALERIAAALEKRADAAEGYAK